MYQDQSNIPHVGRRFNRGQKLESNVDQTDERDDGGRDVVPELVSGKNAANEEVDCSMLVSFSVPSQSPSIPIVASRLLLSTCDHPLHLSDRMLLGIEFNVQTPRPIKLNMKEAYLAT